ncbi:MAG: DUF192 domain-containing protein [Ilumatobacter sp.]
MTVRRLAATAAASVLLLGACAAASDPAVDDSVPTSDEVVEFEPEEPLLEDVGTEVGAVDDDASGPVVDDLDEEELPICPQIPANVWPEDCVIGDETEVIDAVADPDDGSEDAVEAPPASDDVVVDKREIVTTADGEAVLPEDFSTITARVTSTDGTVCDVCLWLADDRDERARGLMGVTDLGDAVGMAFLWDELVDGRFWMFQTPTPLGIAFFDADGDHVGQSEMEPCLTDDSDLCLRYGAAEPYRVAVEMFAGQLGAVGIEPGSSIELLAGTEAPTCPAA